MPDTLLESEVPTSLLMLRANVPTSTVNRTDTQRGGIRNYRKLIKLAAGLRLSPVARASLHHHSPAH